MKLFRTRAGELGHEPMWVAVANGIAVGVDPSLAKVLACLAEGFGLAQVRTPRPS